MSKFNIKYGRLYEIRNRNQLASVHAWGTTAFRKKDVEKAIAKHDEEQGKAQQEAYYTCFDIMQKYGLGKTQVRRFAETRSELANDETHRYESVQPSVVVPHPQKPRSVNELLAYLFYHLPLYHIRTLFSSPYVRWTLRVILFSVWLISICLTCIIAHDNAKLHTIQKKYVLLREFARPNQEWADKADYIEFLYTDESEHQGEIERLWENRRKRLAK